MAGADAPVETPRPEGGGEEANGNSGGGDWGTPPRSWVEVAGAGGPPAVPKLGGPWPGNGLPKLSKGFRCGFLSHNVISEKRGIMVVDPERDSLWWAWEGFLNAIPQSIRRDARCLAYAPVTFRPFEQGRRQKAGSVRIQFDRWGECGMAGVVGYSLHLSRGSLAVTPSRELKRSFLKQVRIRVVEAPKGLKHGLCRFRTKCLPTGEVVARVEEALDTLDASTHATPNTLGLLGREGVKGRFFVHGLPEDGNW